MQVYQLAAGFRRSYNESKEAPENAEAFKMPFLQPST